jgi:acetoin utilization deacetylase AcuC-like enzyme
MVLQRPGSGDSAPWILDRRGRRMPGQDDSRRAEELQSGLQRHGGVRAVQAQVQDDDLRELLEALHEPGYLRALDAVDWEEPRITPEWAPPGLPADSPVWAGVVRSAFEGVRTAVAGAEQLLAGERFAYAVCRPPGHHAGPAWMGGYCYLNTAAAAARRLVDGGLGPVGILDVDFHFPTGTVAVAALQEQMTVHSLHASTLIHVPWREVPEREGERFVGFEGPPEPEAYLESLAESVGQLTDSCRTLVLSLGYDTVRGDPHGEWGFPTGFFADMGELLNRSGMPVCAVQEGGYALESLAECSYSFVSGLLSTDVS